MAIEIIPIRTGVDIDINGPDVRSIARKSNGDLWCVHIHTDGADDQIYVSYSTDNGSTWTEEQVTNLAVNQDDPAIAIDSADNIHVVWVGRGTGTFPARRNIYYRRRTTAWQAIELVTDVNVNQQTPAIAIDSADNIHVVWQEGTATPYEIQYRERTVLGWQAQEAVTAGSLSSGHYSPSIAIDSGDNIHVAWRGYGWGTFPLVGGNLYYRRRTALAWDAIETITDINANQRHPCIAIDSADNIHVVWSGEGHGVNLGTYNIEYRERDAVGWDAIVSLTDLAVAQGTPTIAVDTADSLNVFWPVLFDIWCIREVAGTWGSSFSAYHADPENPLRLSSLWARHPNTNILAAEMYDVVFMRWNNTLVLYELYLLAERLVAPTVATNPATNVLHSTATLNGTLDNDGGEACDCGFEWGLTAAYGNTTPTDSKVTGESFSQAIGGLVSGTTYHFRAVATNSVGTSYGTDRTFTTATALAAALNINKAYALAREEL